MLPLQLLRHFFVFYGVVGLLAGLFITVATSPCATAQVDSVWLADNGLWSESGNWSDGIPNGSFHAWVENGAGTITQDLPGLSLARLSVAAPTAWIDIQHDTSITDELFWDGGTIGGVGTLRLTSGLAQISGGTLGTTFENQSVVQLNAGSELQGDSPSVVWNNLSGSIFDLGGGNSNLTGSGTFNNGTGSILRKTGGAGESQIQWNVHSDGFLIAQEGMLTLSGSHNELGGILQADANAFLRLDEYTSTTFGPQTIFSGQGTLQILGDISSNHTTRAHGFVEFLGGSWEGSGDLILNNSLTWHDGVMSGTGVTQLRAGALIAGGTLDRTLDATAGVIVTGQGLSGTANAVWNNLGVNALFKISGDQHLLGAGTFNNLDGAFLKKSGGTGTSIIEWDVFHEGNMILVEQGQLSLQGHSVLNGQLMVLEDGILDLRGDVEFGPNVTHSENGTLQISGGKAAFHHDYQGDLNTILSGNALIYGSGDINFNRQLDVQTAQLNGTGRLHLNADSQFAIADLEREVHNFGDAAITGLIDGNAATWINHGGASLNFENASGALIGSGTLENRSGATLQQSASGNSSIAWRFDNNGLIVVHENSRLSFETEFTQDQLGHINLHGATIEFASPSERTSIAGQITGHGTLLARGEGLSISARIAPGDEIASLVFDGDVSFTNEAIFDFQLGADFQSDQIFIVDGDVEIDGRLNISIDGGAEAGIYSLLTYDGEFRDNGLELGLLPSAWNANLVHDAANRQLQLHVFSVPEPTTATLLGGLALSFITRRRRRTNEHEEKMER